MASLLRQIVAGPRARHPEAGLDLCYVTDNIIATSGPSGTYPQRAYRNPLDMLVKFLDEKHGEDWAIWEFRAEGTGYPDSEVYDRIYHYPFPDHHPPPFALIPNIMASMRNWLKGKQGRVVVVHCKAGKGRSGTASVSYLVSEEGWAIEDALKRFTERRMRPGFGAGVSIPSQLRWIRYVDRWAKHGKVYVERPVEIMEVHCWGLRDGVKIAIEGFVEEGKTIKTFHEFTRSEREVIKGAIPSAGGFVDVVSEVLGRSNSKKAAGSSQKDGSADEKLSKKTTSESTESSTSQESETDPEKAADVIFRPSKRVVLPTSDVNIDVERRNSAAYGLTMVTSVAHVWFNTFFEGNGPEQNGEADESGVFEIMWDKMDGIKGSSKKGTRAFRKLGVVWKALPDESGKPGIVITEPAEGEEVKQSQPADWKGRDRVTPGEGKDLGLRTASPAISSADVSKANSVKGEDVTITGPATTSKDSLEAVRSHGPSGEEDVQPQSSGPVEQSSSSSDSPPIEYHDAVAVGGPSRMQGVQQQEAGGGANSGTGEHELPQRAEHTPDSTASGHALGTSTDSLPGGKPMEELKTSVVHSLGHISLGKKHKSSS